MKVRDVMTLDVETVTPDDKARTAAQLMADLGCEVLPVDEDNKLVGMITTGDLAVRLMANRCDPDAVTVRETMSTELLYCFESESTEDVSEKMSDWWVRRLPVVNQDKRLIGTVSLADLTAVKSMPIREEASECPGTDRGPLVRQYKRGRPEKRRFAA